MPLSPLEMEDAAGFEAGTARNSEYLPGYAEFSAFIASDPELEIYRSFRRLSVRNLLYLQSEICCIEAQLEELDRDDKSMLGRVSGELEMDIMQRNMDWATFARQAKRGELEGAEAEDRRQAEKMALTLTLRSLLREYREQRPHNPLPFPRIAQHSTNSLPADWWQRRRLSAIRHVVRCNRPAAAYSVPSVPGSIGAARSWARAETSWPTDVIWSL